MRYQGKITEWNDDRGFGFVTTNGTGERYFFHVSELQGSTRRPAVGEVATYEVVAPAGKKPSAAKVRYASADRVSRPKRGRPWGWMPDAVIAGAHVTAPTWLIASGRLPMLLVAGIVGMSLVAFVMYSVDKRRAERDAWRIPESNLQFVGLAGGWLGALAAQRLFRHKSSKPPYVHTFRLFGALGLIAMIGAARYNLADLLHGL
ncbi:cold shock and DUF1294 domain-containing protein [Aromatoleum sp.]|uniref:cold shock and DUF1294 domain-containing protein n=1 Tax=Aromatoleum sp. TaxID=2307007 RepID=UPI002FCA79A8